MNGVFKMIICVLVITGACITYNNSNNGDGTGKITAAAGENVYGDVLRFHVLANSDSDEDQAVKLKVKNEVVTRLAGDMKNAGVATKDEAYRYEQDNMDVYIKEAVGVLRAEGYDYGVRGELGRCWFPVKVYGDLAYPEGEYDAFRILIGKAEGKNWWCVLFPSLCMVDEAYMVQASPVPEDDGQDVKIKFRIVEWFREMW